METIGLMLNRHLYKTGLHMIDTTRTFRGFTLIELMIAVAIVGLLAAIAYPSYQAQVLKSGRADAKVELNNIAQRMQRCFTSTSTYKPDEGVCAVVDALNAAGGILSKEGHYTLTISDHDATTYTLTATVVAGTRQANDISCERFTLNQAGQRLAFSASDADTTDDCW